MACALTVSVQYIYVCVYVCGCSGPQTDRNRLRLNGFKEVGDGSIYMRIGCRSKMNERVYVWVYLYNSCRIQSQTRETPLSAVVLTIVVFDDACECECVLMQLCMCAIFSLHGFKELDFENEKKIRRCRCDHVSFGLFKLHIAGRRIS